MIGEILASFFLGIVGSFVVSFATLLILIIILQAAHTDIDSLGKNLYYFILASNFAAIIYFSRMWRQNDNSFILITIFVGTWILSLFFIHKFTKDKTAKE